MKVNQVGNNQNINSRANISIFAKGDLLSKNDKNFLIEKAKNIGSSSDTIRIFLSKLQGFDLKKIETMIRIFFASGNDDFHKDTSFTIIKGSYKDRQKYSFDFINDYLDSLENSQKESFIKTEE